MRLNSLASCTSHTLVSTLGFAGRCLNSARPGSTAENPPSGGATVTHCAEASVAESRTAKAAESAIPNRACLRIASPVAKPPEATICNRGAGGNGRLHAQRQLEPRRPLAAVVEREYRRSAVRDL